MRIFCTNTNIIQCLASNYLFYLQWNGIKSKKLLRNVHSILCLIAEFDIVYKNFQQRYT